MWSVEGAAVQCRWFFVSMESSGSAAAQLPRRQRQSRQNFYLLSKELPTALSLTLFLSVTLAMALRCTNASSSFSILPVPVSCVCFLAILPVALFEFCCCIGCPTAPHPHTSRNSHMWRSPQWPSKLSAVSFSSGLTLSLAHFVASSTILSFIIPRQCRPFTSLQYICICISSCALFIYGCLCVFGYLGWDGMGWDGNSLLLFADSCLFCDVYSSCDKTNRGKNNFKGRGIPIPWSCLPSKGAF